MQCATADARALRRAVASVVSLTDYRTEGKELVEEGVGSGIVWDRLVVLQARAAPANQPLSLAACLQAGAHCVQLPLRRPPGEGHHWPAGGPPVSAC